MTWLYGVILGLASGVESKLVFRNFFGMSLYGLYPLLLFSLKTRRDVMVFIWNCAFISGIILCFVIVLHIFNHLELVYSKISLFDETGFTVFRVHYAANSFFFLAAIAMAHGSIRNEMYISKHFVNLIILWFFILYLLSFSKGFILALIPFFIIMMAMKRTVLAYFYTLFILVIIFSISVILLFESNNELGSVLFDDELTESSLRVVQFKALANDFSFFGHGLGASLENSTFVRDLNFGYSFELTYLNLIHKLGVFSLLVFTAFGLTLFKGVGMLLSRHSESILSGAVVLTLMLYLVVSWGNPIMFNPICVISHLLALAIVRKSYIERQSQVERQLLKGEVPQATPVAVASAAIL